MTHTIPGAFTSTDYAEIIENLREFMISEQDIETTIDNLQAGYITLADVADFIYAMETGDDDDAFMCAASLGIA